MFADERDLDPAGGQSTAGDRHESESAPLPPVSARSILDIVDPFVAAARVKPDARTLIWYDKGHDTLAAAIAEKCEALGADVFLHQRDFDRDVAEAMTLSVLEIPQILLPQKQAVARAEHVLLLRGPRDPEIINQLDKERRDAYMQGMSEAHAPRTEGKVPWILTLPPTEADAVVERMPFERYFDIYAKACNQNWPLIRERQQILVERLNCADTITLRANMGDPDLRRRTEVRMSIRGMTFVNSTVDQNFPGSETFSAPVLDSVEGQIFAPGVHVYHGLRMQDLYLRIEKGVIVEARAEVGDELLQEILSRGVGARRFGEVALGTNPGLLDRVVNTLLAEKRAKSFHMAIGHCYEYDRYMGIPVNVNNGNGKKFTSVHWDIVVPMDEEVGGGEVLVDEGTASEELIQRNGLFQRPELCVLNPPE
ncbi:MAG: aminopeptidase [Deltaproteobacteria bacterium]|nr:aminopeptidase [Deltaproteobacteria bacterium]